MQPHVIKSGTEYKAIELQRTSDIIGECKVQMPPGWRIRGCSFYFLNPCKIVVTPDVTDEDLGHELRHCFDGNWHSDDNF
jgi:hypothetical protein